jgi:Flp pilus assembly protein TadB
MKRKLSKAELNRRISEGLKLSWAMRRIDKIIAERERTGKKKP